MLALERFSQIGLDIMSLDRPINIGLSEYFKLMRRQFTPDEWQQIDAANNKLHEFYRFVSQHVEERRCLTALSVKVDV